MIIGQMVTYALETWLVAEVGDDGSIVLTPYLQSGPNSAQPGEATVEVNQTYLISQ